jgi:hypothetical protein
VLEYPLNELAALLHLGLERKISSSREHPPIDPTFRVNLDCSCGRQSVATNKFVQIWRQAGDALTQPPIADSVFGVATPPVDPKISWRTLGKALQ